MNFSKPGAVAGVRLGPGRPAVIEVEEGGQALVDDLTARPAVQIHDERDAAGVVFECRVVETLASGGVRHG